MPLQQPHIELPNLSNHLDLFNPLQMIVEVSVVLTLHDQVDCRADCFFQKVNPRVLTNFVSFVKRISHLLVNIGKERVISDIVEERLHWFRVFDVQEGDELENLQHFIVKVQ